MTTDARGRIFYARGFDADRGVLDTLYIWERDEGGRATRRISARAAEWDARLGAWRLADGVAESRLEGRTPPEPISIYATDLDPTAMTLRRFSGYRRSLSWSQIGRMLARPDLLDGATRSRLDDLQRIRWGRVSSHLSGILGLVVAMPFFLRREPANMLTQAVRCAPVILAASIGGVLGSGVAIPGIPAAIGAFAPCVILALLAGASWLSIRT